MAKVERKEFEKGKYRVTHIQFFSRDQGGRPIYKSTDYGLSAWFRTMDGDMEQPAGAVSPSELPLLVYAFGGDPSKLPEDLKTSEALEIAEDEILSADKTVEVNVWKDGKWLSLRGIQGARLPEGEYLLYRDSLRMTYHDEEGKPTWGEENRYGVSTRIALTIAGYADGSPCPFKGVADLLYWRADGMKLLRALIPDMYDNMLVGSGDNELENIVDVAHQTGGLIYAPREIPEGGKYPKWRLYKFQPWEGTLPEKTYIPQGNDDHLQPLFTAISLAVSEESGEKAFDKRGNLSKAGIDWAGEHLRPIADEHGLTNRFTEMDQDTVNVYLEGLGREDLIEAKEETEEEQPPW